MRSLCLLLVNSNKSESYLKSLVGLGSSISGLIDFIFSKPGVIG